jgi:hypothetical protein
MVGKGEDLGLSDQLEGVQLWKVKITRGAQIWEGEVAGASLNMLGRRQQAPEAETATVCYSEVRVGLWAMGDTSAKFQGPPDSQVSYAVMGKGDKGPRRRSFWESGEREGDPSGRLRRRVAWGVGGKAGEPEPQGPRGE